jgi:RimJ/RimL family protein N-acetyltransferase
VTGRAPLGLAMEGAPFIAETPRLQLRRVKLSDAEFLHRLLNEPSWLENIGDRGVRSAADAVSYIRKRIWEPYRSCGFGMYLVQRKEGGVPVGLCGLVQRDFLEHPDLGFALLPEHVGHGYAAEAAQSVIALVESRWAIAQLCAITKSDNSRSLRLLERLGFHRERSCALPNGENLELYLRVSSARVER